MHKPNSCRSSTAYRSLSAVKNPKVIPCYSHRPSPVSLHHLKADTLCSEGPTIEQPDVLMQL